MVSSDNSEFNKKSVTPGGIFKNRINTVSSHFVQLFDISICTFEMFFCLLFILFSTVPVVEKFSKNCTLSGTVPTYIIFIIYLRRWTARDTVSFFFLPSMKLFYELLFFDFKIVGLKLFFSFWFYDWFFVLIAWLKFYLQPMVLKE